MNIVADVICVVKDLTWFDWLLIAVFLVGFRAWFRWTPESQRR